MAIGEAFVRTTTTQRSRKFTAYRTSSGIYEWSRVPMGLAGAPSYFQHAMETEILTGLLYDICEIYIDDIIVFANTPDQLVKNLRRVLARL